MRYVLAQAGFYNNTNGLMKSINGEDCRVPAERSSVAYVMDYKHHEILLLSLYGQAFRIN